MTEYQLHTREVYGDITAIHAPKRKGKTLTAIFFIYRWLMSRNIDAVYSNVHLDFSSIGLQHKVRILDDVDQIRNIKGHNILFIDELRRFADSRLSSSMKNRLVSNLLADTGKQKIDFLYTDQDSGAVDKRIRLNVDTVVYPVYKILDGFCHVRLFDGMKEYLRYSSVGRINLMPIAFAFHGKPCFKFFDTEQKIDDFNIRFKPLNFVNDYLKWAKDEEVEDHKLKTVKLWGGMGGIGLSSKELSYLFTYLEVKGLV